MRTREPYTECKLYVDGFPKLKVGDYLRTPGGSAYLVQRLTPSRVWPQRRNLSCLRWPLEEIPANACVYELHWYKRPKRRPKTLRDLT